VVDLYRTEGIETHVETGISDFSHTNLEWYGGLEWWRLPGKVLRIVPSIMRTREVIRKLAPDIVHLNSSTLAPCAVACAYERVPVVWHIREPLARGTFGLRRALIRKVIDIVAARVIAISQYDADQLTPSDRIRVIYNFVDFSQFDRTLSGEDVRREFGVPDHAPVVVMLGGVARPKGTRTLIRSVQKVLKEAPNTVVLIAGPPPVQSESTNWKAAAKFVLGADRYARTVQREVEALGESGSKVVFTGIRQDIPNILAASDVLVFPSSVPHFARPILEAGAMGKPSVASDLGGPRELIVPEETGYLVPANDAQVLAQALVGVLTDPEHAREMGEAAYVRARRLFDAEANVAATVAVYDELLVN
jgi:glycosyltransferase involved in cell wall biosynthesis